MKGTRVIRVIVTSRPGHWWRLKNAKVYINEAQLCGTLPGTIDKSTDYPVKCDFVGDYVKIFNGENG